MSKTIKGYSNYTVSSDGETIINVKTGKVIKQIVSFYGYPQVTIKSDEGKWVTLRVHRLVVSTFNNIDLKDLPAVNHIDGVRTNNDISNLEACTIKENASLPRHSSKERDLPKGIHHWKLGKKKFRVSMKVNKSYITAYFNELEEAIEYYESKFEEIYGVNPYKKNNYSVKEMVG